VRRIVEAHAGTITVENRPAGGAQFSLRFAAAAEA
jgi:signal transduction histidine kinase